MANRLGQITDIKELLLSKLNAQAKLEFAQMSAEEQEEMINGFRDCIKEYQDVQNMPEMPSMGGGGTPPPMPEIPDDGLDHWSKRPKQQGGGGGGENPDKRRKITMDDEELQGSEDKIPEDAIGGDESDGENGEGEGGGNGQPQNNLDASDKDIDQMNGLSAANAALDAANKAQLAADAAQAAADAAQLAADEALQNAVEDGVDANAAQAAANKAQEEADKAQAAADAALDAADAAQDAANSGDDEGAREAAKEARKNARNSQLSSQRSKQHEKNSKQNASGQSGQGQQLSGQNGNQDGSQQGDGESSGGGGQLQDGQGEGLSGDQKLQSSSSSRGPKKNDKYGNPEGKITEVLLNGDDINFDGDDMCDEEGNDPHEKMKKMAEEAGQPLDAEDYQDPIEREKEIFELVKNNIKNSKNPPNHARGFGNSLTDLVDKLDDLFRVTVDWKNALKKLFNATTKSDSKMIMAKRRMGVDSDHPLYKGRYQHPKMHEFEKEDGIVLVFFLVDNSGSMGFESSEGKKNLKHILSEIVGLEEKTKIKYSAIAYFGAGEIRKDNVRTWTLKDCRNRQKLIDTICRHPGDQGGGTSLDIALNSVIELGKPYYSPRPPETLMIVITDGWDSYDFIDKKLTVKQKARTIFLIVNDSDQALNEIKKLLSDQGIPQHHILPVNTKEWEY